ncbi:MAG TPA: hypothetical protein VGX03_27610, partial [Candidatus Binatia bacterium]|nr:hypothetical protein [Candidatus Binatia bacterium]
GRGLTVERVSVHGVSGEERYVFEMNAILELRFQVVAAQWIGRPWFSVGISDGRPGALVLCSMLEGHTGFDLPPGRHVIRCRVGPLPLGPRTYELWVSVRESAGAADLVDWAQVGAIRVRLQESLSGPNGLTAPWLYGPVRVPHTWSLGDE